MKQLNHLQMITIINNVKLLSETPNNLIDLISILNQEFSNTLIYIEEQLRLFKAEIIINGTTDNYSFIIKSEDEATTNLIQSIIEKATN
jgi:hypothetical protein